jgi:hypothetical protein
MTKKKTAKPKMKFAGKPKARRIKVSWKLEKRILLPAAEKARAKREAAKLSKEMRETLLKPENRDCWELAPPPTKLDCPRCGKTHKIKPKKFAKPMQFFNVPAKEGDKPTNSASYWALCPKTKEPIILFDRANLAASIENVLVKDFAKQIAEEEDKQFLADMAAMTAGKKRKAKKNLRNEKGVVTSTITMKFAGKPQVWQYVQPKP